MRPQPRPDPSVSSWESPAVLARRRCRSTFRPRNPLWRRPPSPFPLWPPPHKKRPDSRL